MFLKRLRELASVIQDCSYTTDCGVLDHEEALQLALSMLALPREQGGMVYIIGNGGSAGIASHFCVDLLKNLEVPASTLVDSNVLTAVANDCGYEQIFSLPLKRLMQPKDLLVAISSSGKSPNILNAVEVAKEKGAKVITFSGFSEGNPLRQMGELNFWINRMDYGLVETAHFFLLHTIIDALLSNASAISKIDFAHV